MVAMEKHEYTHMLCIRNIAGLRNKNKNWFDKKRGEDSDGGVK